MSAILVGILVIQLFLAFYTLDDARSRGHNQTFWFIFVFLFGMFAIIIYVLVRNEPRVSNERVQNEKIRNNPKSDSKDINQTNTQDFNENIEENLPPKNTGNDSSLGIYIGAIIFGIALFYVIAFVVGGVLFPERANWDECDSISVGVSSNEDVSEDDLSDPCVVSDSQWDEYKQAEDNREALQLISTLIGAILVPAIVHSRK